MKKQLTSEQIEKRDARRSQFRGLVKQVANMTDAEKLALSGKVGAILTADGGHIGGTANTMLLVMQLPNVTMVGGFRQWLKVGRCVRKGEHGAMIWVPVGKGGKGETVMAEAKESGENAERPGFIIGTVFDISQTAEIDHDEPKSEPVAAEVKTGWTITPSAPIPISSMIPQAVKVKTVQLSDEVRDVLLQSSINGNCLTLPGQLDRALYMKVAKAIEAAGGKWNRKQGCHVFPGDVRETLNINPDSVEVVNVQQTFQAFYTPEPVAAKVAELADLVAGDRVLEPSAGTGNLCRAAVRLGVFWSNIVAVEINAKLIPDLEINGCITVQGDFMAQNGNLGKFDKVIMNPPFTGGQDVAHIKHGLTFLNPGGRLVAICANGPKQRESLGAIGPALEGYETHWYDQEPGAFNESGTSVNTAIVVIDKL